MRELAEILSYDAKSQLTTQVREIAGVKTTIVDGYGQVGNRATRNTNGALTTWVYDAADRLTKQQATGDTRRSKWMWRATLRSRITRIAIR